MTDPSESMQGTVWPQTTAATVAADPRPLFIDQRGMERKIVWASGVYAVLIVLGLLPDLVQDPLFMALSLLVLTVPSVIAYLVLNICFMAWVYGITKNLAAFRTAGKLASPAWAVAYYFIPFAALLMPYLNMVAVWKASNPEVDSEDFEQWRGGSVSGVIKLWWGMNMLALALLCVIVGVGYHEAHSAAATHPLLKAINDVAVVVGLIVLYVVCRLVAMVNARQSRKEEQLRRQERAGI